MSGTLYNKTSGNVFVLKISSQPIGSKYDILLVNSDLIDGKLFLKSKILFDFPTTLSKNVCSIKIGRISETKLNEIKDKMSELYGL